MFSAWGQCRGSFVTVPIRNRQEFALARTSTETKFEDRFVNEDIAVEIIESTYDLMRRLGWPLLRAVKRALAIRGLKNKDEEVHRFMATAYFGNRSASAKKRE